MADSTPRSPPEGFGRYLLQGGTIMVSILLALVLGAIWEWGSERLREREYMEELVAEFREGQRELEFDMEARRAILDRTERMLGSKPGAGPEAERDVGRVTVPSDSAAAYSSALIDFRYFTPTHPVLDDIVEGGRLDLLRSDELRRALLIYIRERARVDIVEARERDFVANVLEPYLVSNLPLELPPTPDHRISWGPGMEADDLERLLPEPEFRTLLVLRHDRTELALRFSIGLGLSIERVLEALVG